MKVLNLLLICFWLIGCNINKPEYKIRPIYLANEKCKNHKGLLFFVRSKLIVYIGCNDGHKTKAKLMKFDNK